MSKKKSLGWHFKKGIWERIKHYGMNLSLSLMAVLIGVFFYCAYENEKIDIIQKVEGVCSDVLYIKHHCIIKYTPSRGSTVFVVVNDTAYRVVSYSGSLKNLEDDIEGKKVILEYVRVKENLVFNEDNRVCSLRLADGSRVFVALEDAVDHSEENSKFLFCLSMICFVSAVVGAIVVCCVIRYDGESFKAMIQRHKRQKQRQEKKKQKKLTENKHNE